MLVRCGVKRKQDHDDEPDPAEAPAEQTQRREPFERRDDRKANLQEQRQPWLFQRQQAVLVAKAPPSAERSAT